MTALELRLLGGMQIYLDNAPLTALKSGKGKALLCYLAVTGAEHSRSALSGLLWTDLSEDNARANLRKTLSRLKPHLRSYLTITRETIAFNQDSPYHLDVAGFEAGTVSGSDIHHLQESVSLYKGDFLKGFDLPDAPLFDEWVHAQRARLREIALDTLQTLVNHFIDSKEYDSGISYARRLLNIEPWHEETHRNLMYMLAILGQRSPALKQFEECQRILGEELGVEPSPSTIKVFERIQRGELEPGAVLDDFGGVDSIKSRPSSRLREPPPSKLPMLTSPLIGRQREIEELNARLTDPDVRLVTIVGPGGIGKTHLATAISHQMTKTGSFRNGVFLVPLSSVTTHFRLLTAITEQLGLSLAGSRQPEDILFDFLRNKACLLVLDNFEQLLPEADFLARLLQIAPQCKTLVTSRERMKLREEWVLDLDGLPYPDTIQEAQASEYDALLLFSERAQQIRSSFSLEKNLSSVIRICQLTQGMPLALEHAASLVRISNAPEIADQIEERLDALSTTLRNLPERHRSIRAVFDESWRWLSEEEQKVFSRLSVFRGSFTREAAEQVAGANLNALASLADKSLLRVVVGDGETARYDLHELVRQYAAEKLLEAGQPEAAEVHEAHFDFYLSLAEQASQFWDTEKEWKWLERLELERDNLYASLRSVTERAEAERSLQLNAALFSFWLYNSPADEAVDWLELSLSLDWDEHSRTTAQARAQVLKMTGYAALQISDLELAELRFQEAANLYSKLGDQLSAAWILRGSGLVCLIRGDLETAQNFMQESLDICRKKRREYAQSWATYNLGNVAVARGDLSKAEPLLEDAMVYFLQHGRELGMFHTLISLGHLKRAQGKITESKKFYLEALSIQQKTRYIHYTAQILEGLAHIEIANNNAKIAVKLFGASQARCDSIEMKRWAHHEIEFQRSLALTRDRLPDSAWQTAWDEGYNMAPQDALEIALT